MDLNKVMLIGRLTRDPEMRSTPTGTNIATFAVATGYKWTDAQGQKQEKTEFHNVIAWGKLADIIVQYCKKGKQVYLEGRLQTSSWDDKTTGQKRYKTEVVATDMIMLGSASGGTPASSPIISDSTNKQEIVSGPVAEVNPPEIQINDSDMPF